MFLGVERATQLSRTVHARPTFNHGLAELDLQSIFDDGTPAYYFAVPAYVQGSVPTTTFKCRENHVISWQL